VSTALVPQAAGEALERVLIQGDLAKLSSDERTFYYKKVCESVGLNPLTQPFEYINLNGKLRLYAKKDCTDQLRTIHGVSIKIVGREIAEDVYIVTAQAVNAAGRIDESIGAVSIGGLKGENRANAVMKAETKAKRRVTLSICGLGLLDESETHSIPGVAPEFPEIQGSRAAQAEVLQSKLIEAGVPPEQVAEAVEKQAKAHEPKKKAALPKGVDLTPFFDSFGQAKEKLGKERYYQILGNWGFISCREIPDRATAEKIWKEAIAPELKAIKEAELGVSEADLPPGI
jgi:hypothetical protein